MTSSEMTVQQLFFAEEPVIPDKRRNQLEAAAQMAALRGAVKKAEKELRWPLVEDEIWKSFARLLAMPVKPLLVRGWEKHLEIRKYLDKSATAPEETFLVPLARHTLRSEHKPSIELFLNQQPLGDLTFQITLALAFEGAVLAIQDGRIREAQTGTCLASGKISCEGVVLIEKATEKIPLPGRVVF